MSKSASLLRVVGAYVVAVAAGAVWLAYGPDTGRLWLDSLLADLAATVVVFCFSRAHHNSSFYDPYWSVIPPLLVVFWWVQADPVASRAALLTTVVLLWAIRLTWNWAAGWTGLDHEDWRYPLLRDRAGRWELAVDLFAIHVIPTCQVFLGLLPAYVALSRSDRGLGWLDVVALLVGLGAVLLELVADRQLHRFTVRRQSGQVMDQGLWGWSRHPNYFGELSFWLSLALFGLAAAPGQWWWLFAGVAAMLAMFLGASIPMMEQRSLERRPSYQDVIDRVSMLVPLPPRRTKP